jgi:hypothetical protein
VERWSGGVVDRTRGAVSFPAVVPLFLITMSSTAVVNLSSRSSFPMWSWVPYVDSTISTSGEIEGIWRRR